MDSIVLVGPRASGKTTLAAALAVRLRWPVLDGDVLVAAAVGRPAGAFLAAAGEPSFRAVEETMTLLALAAPDPKIVALGGGAVLSAAVRVALGDPARFVVLLQATPGCLIARLRGDGQRPPLTDLPLAEEVAALWRARRSLYETVADFRLQTTNTNVDACVELILAKMDR